MSPETLEPSRVNTITGDLSAALRDRGREVLRRYPKSVRAYALSRALVELCSMYDDDQGIPASDASRIDQSLLNAIQRLLDEGAFLRGELPSESVVEDLVAGLASLNEVP